VESGAGAPAAGVPAASAGAAGLSVAAEVDGFALVSAIPLRLAAASR
jgi:hypothetical protein